MPLTAGSAVPIAYGYQWVTGSKLQGITLTDTGNDNLDYTRVGMWLLGDGEWDGLIELWDTALGRLMLQAGSKYDNPNCFQFHSGADAVVGSGFAPTSTGNDQGVDTVWSSLPAGLQPLHYNRWAYYTLRLKWPINNAPNTNQNDASVWADLNPIGLWRSLRCRLFDASGNQAGYGFTRNPAWHYVDLMCRRKLFPEYNIDVLGGIDELPAAVAARFDWAAIADSAAYYSEVLSSTGQPRFSGDYAFTQSTTLQSCLTQIAQNCRSFHRERAGMFALIADRPRASIFTFTRKNSDNFLPDGSELRTAPNQFTAKYRDLYAPAAATITSISCPDHQLPHVGTEAPHCFAAGDYVIIGNTGTLYDGYASVQAIDTPDGDGNSYGLTLNNLGSAVPVSVGGGGLIGLRYSRFKDRAPEFRHKANQLAKGGVGIGIPRQRLRVKVSTDFANTTWDQVSRVTAWQMGTQLGPDVQPYLAPQKFSLQSPFFANDAAGSGAMANQVEPGDVVTVDDTLSAAYAGLYEVVSEHLTLTGSTGNGPQRTPQDGKVSLSLRPYSDTNYPDDAPAFEPGWPTVPILPGNARPGNEFPLADGFASFISGSGVHGQYFEVPDGYSSRYMLAWASPQGFIEGNAHLHYITDCDAYQSRLLQLIYNDGSGTTWNGAVNWSALCWRTRNSAIPFTLTAASSGAVMTYVELVLLGGERVIFGKGIVASGKQIPLPTGYTDVRTSALAFGKNAGESGHPAHGFCAYVDGAGVVQHIYNDNSGNQWNGSSQVMVFSYLNNMNTWKKDANGWAHCTLPGGKVLSVGGFSLISSSLSSSGPTIFGASTVLARSQQDTLPLMAGMPTDSIQVMPGIDGYQITDNDAHGVKENYLQEQPDGSFNVLRVFEDGEGNEWQASGSVLALLYDTPNGAIGSSAAPGGGLNWTATLVYTPPSPNPPGGPQGGPVHSNDPFPT
jgi:hypothetical protein